MYSDARQGGEALSNAREEEKERERYRKGKRDSVLIMGTYITSVGCTYHGTCEILLFQLLD